MRISEIGRLGLAWHAPGACFAVICAEVYSTNPSTDTKAADKDPTVGRLYHHLAILAKPNALQQLYYYSRSLTCVKPFPSARESILTLLDPILGRAAVTYSHALPIDTNYIKARTLLFEKLSLDDFEQVTTEFLDNLDNHIGRVTAKWEEQGVYIAVTNVASWFNYGVDDNPLRQVFLTELVPHFEQAKKLTFDTFALALRRVRDKNVLPHVHIMLLFLSTFASNKYVSHLLFDTPWAELVVFLNTLIKTES
ncbi:hypothetical protein HBI84_250190 [Parastagonospora nodorum]|nr:hypothetical protein HBI84_250190 [Parastagonospora nodorum]